MVSRKIEAGAPVSINDQIAVVKRHVMRIENTYPRLVKECAMTEERANNEIVRFKAALATLMHQREREAVTTLKTFTPPAPYKADLP